LGFAASRLAEWRVHQRNYRVLMAAGAEERAPLLAKLYYATHWLLVPAALLEQLLLHPAVSRMMLTGGLVAIAGALALRVWSIQSLGGLWTMRCLALPGLRERALGPYRWIRNPEYLSRLIDGIGICLVLGSQITLLAYLILTLALNRRLSALEKDQLLTAAEARPSWRQDLETRPL
jgi:isoprenylcysteine carboxyl methyltransferase (ICMT) family protein YpbQ